MYLAECLPEIARIFDNLDTVDGIEFTVLMGQLQEVADLTFHPSETGATFTGRCYLVRANVDSRDMTCGTDKLSGLEGVGAATAT